MVYSKTLALIFVGITTVLCKPLTNSTLRNRETRLLTPGPSSSTVAFSVARTTKLQVNPGDVIKYDRVDLNVGNGFDVTRGVFVCPASGIYVFHLHGFSENNEILWIELYHNHNQVMTVWCHEQGSYESCGNTAALLVVKGDEVKAVSRTTSTVYAVFDNHEVYNTFTGYMIATENPNIQLLG